jgi:hypothetical protein
MKNESGQDYLEFPRLEGGASNLVEVQSLTGAAVRETRRGAIRSGRIDITQMTQKELAAASSYLADLKAGEMLTEFVNVSALYIFDTPGKYRIQVRTGVPPNGEELVQSNPIIVTVTP